MLVSFYLPFSDFRELKNIGFRRLSYPDWPTPSGKGRHVRGIGSIQTRRKSGLEGWVGENQLAVGLRSFALRLPYIDTRGGLGRIRLIRKACYFDGLLNGRFEFLIGVERAASERNAAFGAGDILADTEVTLRFQNGNKNITLPLRAAGHHAAQLWAQATVAHRADPLATSVMARRPVCVVESDQPISKVQPQRSLSARAAAIAARDGIRLQNLRICLATAPSSSMDHLLVSVSDRMSAPPEKNHFCRYCCRYLRTYNFRILQDLEGLSLILNDRAIDIEDARVQNLLNEYTWRIYRSQQRLEEFSAGELVRMAYASFETLYPGQTDGLRAKVHNSRIRPNLAKKLLLLFNRSQASIIVTKTMHMETVMGDKFEKLNIENSQGVAIGRGASAKVEESTNVNAQELSRELRALAEAVGALKDRPDADVEGALVKAAADKAEAGDEMGAADLLNKSATWVLDIAKSAGSAVLTAFMKSSLGL